MKKLILLAGVLLIAANTFACGPTAAKKKHHPLQNQLRSALKVPKLLQSKPNKELAMVYGGEDVYKNPIVASAIVA